MIDSQNSRFVVGLILACTCGLALCSEPKEAKTDLRFHINSKNSQPWLSRQNNVARGPVEPTHVAIFHVQTAGHHMPRDYKGIPQMLKTSAGKALSKRQRQFLSIADALVVWGAQDMRNHQTVRLYAVSADDVRKMVEAYLEVGTTKARAEFQSMKTRLQDCEERVASTRKEIPKKEAELAAVTVEYEKAKMATHSPSSDSEAAEESKGIILEMNTVLDSLAIEIAGIEAKLEAVERIKSEKNVSSPEGLARLEDVISEQAIDLAGAQAKKKAATGIREREERFHSLYRRRTSLTKHISGLKKDLGQAQRSREEAQKRLFEREPHTLTSQVYENEVTIYRVGRR